MSKKGNKKIRKASLFGIVATVTALSICSVSQASLTNTCGNQNGNSSTCSNTQQTSVQYVTPPAVAATVSPNGPTVTTPGTLVPTAPATTAPATTAPATAAPTATAPAKATAAPATATAKATEKAKATADAKTSTKKDKSDLDSVPKTGDTSNVTLAVSVMAAALVAMVSSVVIKKKNKHRV